jgi:hypothetical protein
MTKVRVADSFQGDQRAEVRVDLEPEFPVMVGRCIYCGSVEGLSDEHVIPYGLGGQWKLLDASCRKCADVTSAIEGRVLRWGLGDLRRKLSFPTRRPKRGPISLGYRVGEEDRNEDVPPEDHHGGFIMPVLAPPACLSDGPPRDLPLTVGGHLKWHTPSLQRLVDRSGAQAVNLRLVDPIDLTRMLAKIAYAFAVGCLGPNAFEEVYVLPTILHGPNAGQYVGCVAEPPKNSEVGLHQITLVFTPRDVIAYVRLFAQMRMPEYTVVVGRVRGLAQTDAA